MKEMFVKPLRKLPWIALFSVILWACQDDSAPISSEQASQQSSTTARDNTEIIAATQSAMEITAGVFDDQGISNGRAGSTSGRLNGHHDGGEDHDDDDEGDDHDGGCLPSISGSFNLDRSHQDSLIYTGTITIDYGDGSTCDSTDVRKGKITDSFTCITTWGDSVTFTSTETITLEGFVKDSIQLDGTFIIKKVNRHTKSVEVQNARITYPDGTSATWSGTLNYTYERGSKCKWRDNTIYVTGSISGTNRDGVDFSLVITEDLVFKYSCGGKHHFRPVSGVVEVTVGGILSTVDFGDGTCDRKFTVTTNGTTQEYEFENGHHGGHDDGDDDDGD